MVNPTNLGPDPFKDIFKTIPGDENLLPFDIYAEERKLNKQMKTMLPSLMKEAFSARMEFDAVASESARHGGATTFADAVLELMKGEKFGMRSMAQHVGISRKKLERMLYGILEMPGEVTTKITEFLEIKLQKKF